MKKILVATDGSEFADLAIEKGKELAKVFNAEVILVNVNDFEHNYLSHGMEEPLNSNIIELSWDRTKELLEEGKAKFGEIADKVQTVSLKGNVAEEIIEFVNANDVDLVIVGSHGKSGIQRFLLGSVAQKIVQQATKPVLVVK